MAIHIYIDVAGHSSFVLETSRHARVETVMRRVCARTGLSFEKILLMVGTPAAWDTELLVGFRLSDYNIGHLTRIMCLRLDF